MTHSAQKSWLAPASQQARNSLLPGSAPQWLSKLKKDNCCLGKSLLQIHQGSRSQIITLFLKVYNKAAESCMMAVDESQL